MITLEQFKLYAHIDGSDEDAVIGSMLTAADAAVRDMTGKAPPGGADEVFDIAVLQLAAHWYENRTPVTDGGSVTEVPFTLQALLNHISMSSRYPEGSEKNGADE